LKQKIKHFTTRLGTGLKQEYHETKQIPRHIKERNFKEALLQIGDLGKMSFLAVLWILPAGGILSGFIVKYSKKIRPSAFQDPSLPTPQQEYSEETPPKK
jgi:hypothetical protein